MGEVYRARDSRLGRDVAIKVLPPGLSSDPERLQRFEQEARAAAALNHPNILAVYDIGTDAAAPYIVSELLEGETLRDRTSSALPARKAVEFAIQVARGLSAAHEKGIVHRDLKPDNVFVTSDGRVKILDFGLAKLTEAAPAATGTSMLPTTPPNTLPGMVLGTIGYMAPEQVRGLAADQRTDIFAFGALLYEMLSGQRAFGGDTAIDVVTAILKEDPPDLPSADRQMPLGLQRIVGRCLEKNPSARFQTMSDLAFALESLSSGSGVTNAVGATGVGSGVSLPRTVGVGRWAHLAWLALTIAVAALVGSGVYFVARPRSEPPSAIRFQVLPPSGTVFPGVTVPIAISPDGRRAVFTVAKDGQVAMLAVRSFDTLESQLLPGTEGLVGAGGYPFWSPDSRSIAFFAQGKLQKIDATGGPPQVLCDASFGQGGTWNREGVIVFGPNGTGGLFRVSAAGGTPSPVTTLDIARKELSHRLPWFLPDGRHFLYAVTLPSKLFIGSLDSSERQELVAADSGAVYSDGHLLFVRQGTLLAQPFDAAALKVTGDAFPVAQDISVNVGQQRASLSVSTTGVLAYRTLAGSEPSQLVWFDRAGKQLGTVGDRVDQMNVALSPDGMRAAVSVLDPAGNTRDIELYDLSRNGLRTRFTFDPADEFLAIWSPDGSRLAFSSSRKGRLDIYQKASNGVGSEDLMLADSMNNTYPWGWSSDGRFIGFSNGNGNSATGNDVWVLPVADERKPVPVVQTPFNESASQFSPDGRWLAYQSNESGGRNEVFVIPFTPPVAGSSGPVPSTITGKWQVSTAGGTTPRWRRDGKELFYLSADNKLIAAAVNGQGAAFQVSGVTPLFEVHRRLTGYQGYGLGYNYDVSADGQRFLVNTVTEQPALVPITVVVNWTAGLRK